MLCANEYLFLEPAALNVMDITNRKKRVRVPIPDDGLELRFLEAGDDDENNLFAVARIGPFSFEIRHAAAETLGQRIANLFVFIADDPYRFRLVDAFVGDINHFKGDEIRDKRVHGVVPAEHEPCARQNEHVDEHDDFADGKRRFLVDKDRHDFAAVRRSPCTDDQAYSKLPG